MEHFPKVLVSTIPSWSQTSGANTFSTLFDGYPSDKVSNIYTRADLPDSRVCDRYFQILEGSVMKSCFKRNTVTGREVNLSANNVYKDKATSERKRYSFFGRHRWAIFLWLRELGWKMGKWRSKELDAFLESVNPEVFVYHIESYWYFNRLNRYIIEKVKPKKVVGYLWDDNFTYKQSPYSLTARINRYITRRQVKRLVAATDTVLAISPQMKTECDKEFEIDSVILTKPILATTNNQYHRVPGSPIRIVYSGSLVIGRDKAIAMLVDCLKEVNKDGVKIYLDIYSATSLTGRQRKRLDVPGTSHLKGSLPQQEVFREQENCDILLFAENPDNRFDNIARLSFSTKITDYLSRNRTILAIGPDNVAPMIYLHKEDAAIVCHNSADIMTALNRIIGNPAILQEYAAKAFVCGELNHSRAKILSKFREIIMSEKP